MDILPFLLLPLAGPEDFSEEEMERLPVDLQYLPPDKQREPDADIRKMLVEAVMLVSRGPVPVPPPSTPTPQPLCVLCPVVADSHGCWTPAGEAPGSLPDPA